MIAYNNQWLNNLLVRSQADQASENNCISRQEKEQVYTAYPVGFYTPNFFVRIGLFILTVIIVFFTLGLFSLPFLDHYLDSIGGLFLFFGLITYTALEVMVNKRHHKSGVDDALLWLSAGNIVGGLNGLTNISAQTNALIIFVVALFLFLRFVNSIMAAIACLAFLAIIFLGFVQLGAVGKAITPFVIMLVSALIYFFVHVQIKMESRKHYVNGLQMIAITALVCFYAAGNYFVVREASIAMLGMELRDGESITLGWLFWLFTVAIPLLYIIRGLQKKDAVLLRVGLLLVAAIVFTVRNYYHVLPAEIAMVLIGVIFIVLAYALIKYLHEPKYGFTYKEQNDAFFMDKLQVESLVIAQTFSGPALPADSGTQFGGGSGSGGGASGEF